MDSSIARLTVGIDEVELSRPLVGSFVLDGVSPLACKKLDLIETSEPWLN